MNIKVDFIKDMFHEHGLDYLGASSIHVDSAEEQEAYDQQIAKNDLGNMSFLKEHQPVKFHPDLVVPKAKEVWFCALPYYQSDLDQDLKEGKVALYAHGRDYHKVIGKKLKKIVQSLGAKYPGEEFRSFVDAGPLAEVFWAEKAGLGFRGRNSLLITKDWGSYVFLGQIISSLPLEPTYEPLDKFHGSCPSGCRRCLDACPTKALYEPYKVNPSKCISYLTIEEKGMISPSLWPQMGNWVFGCDLCQTSCPHNLRAKETQVQDFLKPIAGGAVSLKTLLNLTEETILQFAGSPLMRAKRRGLVRNALIAAMNKKRLDLKEDIISLMEDHDPVIQETAQKVIKTLLVFDENS